MAAGIRQKRQFQTHPDSDGVCYLYHEKIHEIAEVLMVKTTMIPYQSQQNPYIFC